MKELFKGHNNLISGINIFLPKGSVTALDNDKAHPQELFNEAWSFVTKIKVKLLFCSVEFQLQMLVPSILMMTFVPTETLSNDISVYLAFLDILNEFRKGRNINTVHNQVNICYGSVYFTAPVLEGFLVNVNFNILRARGFCFTIFIFPIFLMVMPI